MKFASSALIALLDSWNQSTGNYVADLLTIVLQDGTIVRVTTAATNILSTSFAQPTFVQAESHTVPGFPYQLTVSNPSLFYGSRGVLDATAKLWLSPIPNPLATPGTNQYIVKNDTGVFGFGSGANGHTVDISYVYCPSTIETFAAGGVSFSRSRITSKIGLESEDMDLVLLLPPSATLEGFPWPQAVALGLLDYAAITIERAYMPSWGNTSAGTTVLFQGYVGTASPSRNTIKLAVHPITTILNNQMPRRTYQPGCLHVLYDTGCTLHVADFTTTGTVGSGATVSVIPTNLTAANGYYSLGKIMFADDTTTVTLQGISRTVYGYVNASGAVTVIPPLPVAPVDTDTFSIYPGCDKSQGTCTTTFSNLAHFAGFPYLPVQEQML